MMTATPYDIASTPQQQSRPDQYTIGGNALPYQTDLASGDTIIDL